MGKLDETASMLLRLVRFEDKVMLVTGSGHVLIPQALMPSDRECFELTEPLAVLNGPPDSMKCSRCGRHAEGTPRFRGGVFDGALLLKAWEDVNGVGFEHVWLCSSCWSATGRTTDPVETPASMAEAFLRGAPEYHLASDDRKQSIRELVANMCAMRVTAPSRENAVEVIAAHDGAEFRFNDEAAAKLEMLARQLSDDISLTIPVRAVVWAYCVLWVSTELPSMELRFDSHTRQLLAEVLTAAAGDPGHASIFSDPHASQG